MKTFLIRHKLKLVVAALVVVAGLSLLFMRSPENMAVSGSQKTVAQAGANPSAEQKAPWSVRCTAPEGDPARECEIFQRLIIAKTGQRVAELAVGFPKDKKEGRGVIVLPLGILLEDGIEMQIDQGQKFKFKPRYCTTEGCFAFINVDQPLLDAMKGGTAIEFYAKAMIGKDIKIKMTLNGLVNALEVAAAASS